MSGAAELLRCQPWIEAALEYSGGTHSVGDVIEGIADGRMQLWPAPRGCAVTEIVVYPRRKVLHIFLAGGELDQLIDGFHDVAAWARGQGCTGLTLSGRRGWERALKSSGWRLTMVTMEKDI